MILNNNIIITILILLIIYNYYIINKISKNKENFSNGFQDDKLLNEDIQRQVKEVVDNLKLTEKVNNKLSNLNKDVKKKLNGLNTKVVDILNEEVNKNNGKIDGAIKKIPKTVDERVKVIYKTDIDAIRNLSTVANKLQSGGLTIPGDLTVKGKFNYLPKGTILAYNGTKAPSGWAICDGKTVKDSNGKNFKTPDLRGKFIYGYSGRGRSRTLRGTGGAEYVKLTEKQMPKHNHSLTINNGGKHTHRQRACKVDDLRTPSAKYGNTAPVSDNNWGCYDLDLRTMEDGDHNHGHSMGKTGSSHSHENMPPYYVLLYIIKL